MTTKIIRDPSTTRTDWEQRVEAQIKSIQRTQGVAKSHPISIQRLIRLHQARDRIAPTYTASTAERIPETSSSQDWSYRESRIPTGTRTLPSEMRAFSKTTLTTLTFLLALKIIQRARSITHRLDQGSSMWLSISRVRAREGRSKTLQK